MSIGWFPSALKGIAEVSTTASVVQSAHTQARMRNQSTWREIADRTVSSPPPKCALPVDRARRPLENSIGLHSQNVQGLPKDPVLCAQWFSNFRQHEERGPLDVVLLQETHVLVGEAHGLDTLYCATWGFNSDEKRDITLWSESSKRRGGVAILLNPYSTIQAITPWMEEAWTPHWMGSTVTIHNEEFLILNVYAPNARNDRESLFKLLTTALQSFVGPVIIGGDWNCTLFPSLDRSHVTTNGTHHYSPELRRLLDSREIVDVLEDDIEIALAERGHSVFHSQTHTYNYTLQGGVRASSRLDRWYVSARVSDWIRDTSMSVPGPTSDHNGVTVRLAAPKTVVQQRKPRRVYPVAAVVHSTAKNTITQALTSASLILESVRHLPLTDVSTAINLARWWDVWKVGLRRALLNDSRTIRQKITNSYRHRLRRLQVNLHAAKVSNRNLDETVTILRQKVAECRRNWQRRKREQLLRQHTYRPGATTRRFFARVSLKFRDNTITSLGGTAPYGPNRSRDLANDMADGWADLLHRHLDDQECTERFLARAPTPPSLNDEQVVSAIDSADVLAAIKKCKHGKASGPDEIGNSFYKDFSEELAPILSELYTRWLECGVTPCSFGEANIHCLKKSSTSSRPLDHRPIALLNSDYKIFTKILATRLRAMLPFVVDTAQVGFVPGRNIATALDIFAATKIAAKTEEATKNAIVLLLDFAKAYDTLQRPFLLAVLKWLGFSQKFVAIVSALHANTTCKFLVNGFLSRKVKMNCGIRQGCPMAHLLFILSLDSAYKVFRMRSDIHGVRIASPGREETIVISGYADDTAVYLAHYREIPKVLEIFGAFQNVSGLAINKNKSIVVQLGSQTTLSPDHTLGLTLLNPANHCRYLGVQVGHGDFSTINWDICIQAVWARLALARQKTHSVEQRSHLVRAIAVPKFLYVARHCWPSKAIIFRLSKLIKDFIWGTRDGKRNRPWVPAEQTELPIAQGGLAAPCITTELITMAAKTVGKWAASSGYLDRLIGDALWGEARPNPFTLPQIGLGQYQSVLNPLCGKLERPLLVYRWLNMLEAESLSV